MIERDELAPFDRAAEILAFGLRMNSGWGLDEFRSVTRFDLMQNWGEVVRDLVGRGWMELHEHRVKLTSTGHRFADAAGAEILSTEPLPAA